MTQKAWAFLGGKQVPQEDAKVGVMTHALHYGTSVFEESEEIGMIDSVKL